PAAAKLDVPVDRPGHHAAEVRPRRARGPVDVAVDVLGARLDRVAVGPLGEAVHRPDQVGGGEARAVVGGAGAGGHADGDLARIEAGEHVAAGAGETLDQHDLRGDEVVDRADAVRAGRIRGLKTAVVV